jgi:hypothetical protein
VLDIDAVSIDANYNLRFGLDSGGRLREAFPAQNISDRTMTPGRKYSPAIDQAALVAAMDLAAVRSCKSFDRLCREIERLISLHARVD